MKPYELIEAEKANFATTLLCEALGVSRSGYYEWRGCRFSERDRTNEKIVTHIRSVHAEHKRRYGSPRMTDELKSRGLNVNRKRIERLMRRHALAACFPRKFRRTTDSNHNEAVAPNLLGQQFCATARDQIWVGDITYIWTLEGWAYLAVLIDLHSRRAVGWAMGKTLSKDLAIRALTAAIAARKPAPGLIHHTDRGGQYVSSAYKKVLRQHGIVASMSGKGNCYDNAVAESFFATLKKELIHRVVFESRSHAYRETIGFITRYYNVKRRHSANGNVSPMEFENSHRLPIAA